MSQIHTSYTSISHTNDHLKLVPLFSLTCSVQSVGGMNVEYPSHFITQNYRKEFITKKVGTHRYYTHKPAIHAATCTDDYHLQRTTTTTANISIE
jgi:hypothetical protein